MDWIAASAIGSLVISVVSPYVTLKVMESRLTRAEKDIAGHAANHALLIDKLESINQRLARIEGKLGTE